MSDKVPKLSGVMAQFDAMLAASTIHKFTPREIRILLRVPTAKARKNTPPPSVVDVSDDLRVNRPSISRCITVLIEHGLLESVRDPTDKRKVCLTRTVDGEAFVKRIERAALAPLVSGDTEGL